MTFAPYSLYSSCLLLTVAGILQALLERPTPLSVSFLLLGVTSVIHHCRLDAWWTYDIWRVLDYLAIVVFIAFATSVFKNSPVYWVTSVIVSLFVILIWSELVAPRYIPCIHACMHVIVSSVVLLLYFSDPTKFLKW